MAHQALLTDRSRIRRETPVSNPSGAWGSSFALGYWIFFFALWIVIVCGSATDATAQIYRGKVVDAENGQPLEGAVFVIVWEKKGAISMNGSRDFHSAKEALTDAKGEFSVDGSPGVDWNPFTYVVKDPDIAIYMPGYGPYPVGHVMDVPQQEIVKSMTGAGAVIKLPKLKTQQEMRQFTGPENLRISSG